MYSQWNRAIGQHFLNPARSGQAVILAVDDTTLLEIAHEAELPLEPAVPKEAGARFSAVVRQEILENGWETGVLEKDRYPRCLALVAFFVLVAFRMKDSEDATASAYWARYSELIERRPSGEELKKLWRKGFEGWANQIQLGEWGRVKLPPDRKTSFRWVRLAQSQVLLRIADLRRLPQFFSESGIGLEADRSEIERVLSNQGYRLPQHVRSVLKDPARRPNALDQIEQALAGWDQTTHVTSSVVRATEQLRCWIRWLDEEVPRLEGGLQAPKDSGRLVPGVTLSDLLATGDLQLAGEDPKYQSFQRDALLAVWDPWAEIFSEVRAVHPEEEVLVLLKVKRNWQDFQPLAASREVEVFRSHEVVGLPEGWVAVRFVVASSLTGDLGPWADLILLRRRLWAEGGLRLSRKEWMVGAGPWIAFDHPIPTEAWVDDASCPIIDGRLTPDNAPQLDEEGAHEIRVVGFPPLQVRVVSPRLVSSISSEAIAWRAELSKWPSGDDLASFVRSSNSSAMDGVWFEGTWRGEETKIGSSHQRQWLEAALASRGFFSFPKPTISDRRLIRLLNNAALRRQG